MEPFLSLAFLFALSFSAECQGTGNRTTDRDLDGFTKIVQEENRVTSTTALPTSISGIQKSDVPNDETPTTAPFLSTTVPAQTDNESNSKEEDSQFIFFTKDARKLTILALTQTVAVIILLVIVAVLFGHRRSMQRKMRRLKENKTEVILSSRGLEGTTCDEIKVQNEGTLPDEALTNNLTTAQNVEYAIPYEHQQNMAHHIKNLVEEGNSTANENSAINNHFSNQIAPNRLPADESFVDINDYTMPRIHGPIMESVQEQEETELDDETIDEADYKIPRNCAKRSGLVSIEPSPGNSTLKDSMDYVAIMNYADSKEGKDQRNISQSAGSGRVHEWDTNIYDVPSSAGPRLVETFSRKSIRTKIKVFHDRLKIDKSKCVVPDGKTKPKQEEAAIKPSSTGTIPIL